MPVRVVQKLQKPIPLEVIAAQLHLNGWLDEQLVDRLLGNAKECVITVSQTDYGPEVLISGKTAQSKDQETNFPGFYAAKDLTKITIPDELSRAASYIGRKYTPRMGAIKIKPVSYQTTHIDVDTIKKSVTATIKSHTLEFATEHDYWLQHVAPALTEHYDEGRAVRVLSEVYQHHKRNRVIPHTREEAWARDMVAFSIYSLREMMAQHARKSVSIKSYKNNYSMDNIDFLVFYNPENIRKIENGEKEITVNVSHISRH